MAEDDIQCKLPVFCTVDCSIEHLAETFSSNNVSDEEMNPYLTLIDTTDVGSITTPTSKVDEVSFKPFASMGSHFLGWSSNDLYHFFKSNIAPLARASGSDMCNGPWTWHTFIIIDSLTVDPENGSLLLCSDAPDFGEEERVVLKSVRVPVKESRSSAMCLETYVRCPSETGRSMCLSVMPPCFDEKQRRAAMSYGDLKNDCPLEEAFAKIQGEA